LISLSLDMALYASETSVPLERTYDIATTTRKPTSTNNVFLRLAGFEKRFLRANTKLNTTATPKSRYVIQNMAFIAPLWAASSGGTSPLGNINHSSPPIKPTTINAILIILCMIFSLNLESDLFFVVHQH